MTKYVVIDDELCYPVRRGHVVTVITRSTLADRPPPAGARSLAELEADSRAAGTRQRQARVARRLAKALARRETPTAAEDEARHDPAWPTDPGPPPPPVDGDPPEQDLPR